MLLQIGNMLQSHIRTFLEQFAEQILQIITPVFVEIRLTMLNLVKELTPVFGVEWRQSMH